MIESISLLGSSSGRNAGDAALMSGIMESCDSACGKQLLYEIPTIKPGFVSSTYQNRVKPISMLPWNLSIKMLGLPTYNSVMRSDLSLIFDAILFDRALYNPLFNFLSTLYVLLPRAKKKGKKMGFFNVGCGPVRTPTGKMMLRELSEMMDFITVRDQDSYDILKNDLGVKNPRILLTADAALNVTPSNEERVNEIVKTLGLDFSQDILGINVNTYIDTWSGVNSQSMGKEKFVEIYAEALNQALKTIRSQVLFVCTQHDDLQITKDIMNRVKSPEKTAMITNFDYSHFDIKGVLKRISLLFGMRLHAMILCSAELTPIIGLAYQPKCEYYFRTLQIPEYSLSFKDFSVDALVDHLLKGWEKRSELKAKLRERIPFLQNEAHKAGQIVGAMHRGENIDRFFPELENNTKTQAAA